MTDSPFITPAVAAGIKKSFRQLYQTTKLLGEVVEVTFSRKDPDTNVSTNHIVSGVLLNLADRQADIQQEPSFVRVMTQGKLSKEVPFDIQAGDRFVIKGIWGRVVVVYPEMNGKTEADIQFDNPYA